MPALGVYAVPMILALAGRPCSFLMKIWAMNS